MSLIFICPGDCEICEEFETCPKELNLEAKARKSLTDTFGSPFLADTVLDMVKQISVKNIVKLLDSSLFKLIQLLLIENEHADEFSMTKENIQEQVKSIFPQEQHLLIELFHQGHQRAKNDPLVQKMVNKLIPELADKIISVIKGTCDKKCRQCWLMAQCPKYHEGSMN